MKKNLKLSWLNSFQKLTNKNKKNEFNSTHKTYIELNQYIFDTCDKNIIKEYLISFLNNVSVLENTSSIVVFPKINNLLNFEYSDNHEQIKNKIEIIRNLKIFCRKIISLGLRVYFTISVDEIFSFDKRISRILEYAEFNSNSADSDNFWYQKNNQETKENLIDFIKTQSFTLKISKNGQSYFKESLSKVVDYFKNSFISTGFVISDFSKVFTKNKEQEQHSFVEEINHIFNVIKQKFNVNFALKDNFSNKEFFNLLLELTYFDDYFYDLSNLQKIEEVNNIIESLYLTKISFVLNNDLENNRFNYFADSKFYKSEIIKSFLSLQALMSQSIYNTYIPSVEKYSDNSRKNLEKKNIKTESHLAGINLEKTFFNQILVLSNFYFKLKLIISSENKLKILSPMIEKVFIYKIISEDETYYFVFNPYISSKKFTIKDDLKIIYTSGISYFNDTIRPYHFEIYKKVSINEQNK